MEWSFPLHTHAFQFNASVILVYKFSVDTVPIRGHIDFLVAVEELEQLNSENI